MLVETGETNFTGACNFITNGYHWDIQHKGKWRARPAPLMFYKNFMMSTDNALVYYIIKISSVVNISKKTNEIFTFSLNIK